MYWILQIKFYFASLLMMIAFVNANPLFSLEYGIFANHQCLKPITKVFVIGERCSGTNFLTSLICENSTLRNTPIGGKHFPPWYQLGPEYYSGNPQYYTFNDTDDYLFLVIFRNPYDWVRSFRAQPHHCHGSLKNLPLSQFIRREWNLNLGDKNVIGERSKNPLMDVNPENRLSFANVLALRTAKIRNMLEIKNLAPNVYYINYETARDHPQEVLAEITDLYYLDLKPIFKPIMNYRGSNKPYTERIYDPIEQNDLDYINSQLDKELEKQIGYELTESSLQTH